MSQKQMTCPTWDVERYHHTTLVSRPADKPASLRLVYVKPHLRDGLIDCTMHHLDFRSRYSAVSYAWGNADDNRKILINGRQFRVRKNLWAFLDHARPVWPSRVYWIDALSINQENPKEKTHQIQMMGRIYRLADEVLAWLGPVTEETSHFMTMVTTYGAMTTEEMLLESSRDSAFWNGFRQIKNAEYWKRAWTAQEFLLPRSGRLVAGQYSVGKEGVATFLRHLRLCHERGAEKLLEANQASISLLSRGFKIMWHLDSERAHSGERWWQMTRSRYCFDIRDRIYAILSLKYGNDLRNNYSINPFELFYGLRVDYSIDPFELFLESLWLGHQLESTNICISPMEAKTAREFANMLEVTPAGIILYAQMSSHASTTISLPIEGTAWEHHQSLHLRAAASPKDRAKYLNTLKLLPGSHDFGPDDHWVTAHILPNHLQDSHGAEIFPSGLPLPIELRSAQDPYEDTACFRLLVSTVIEQSTTQVENTLDENPAYSIDDLQFLNRKCSWCYVSGIYKTKCTVQPRRIYYMLVDQCSPEYHDGLEPLSRVHSCE